MIVLSQQSRVSLGRHSLSLDLEEPGACQLVEHLREELGAATYSRFDLEVYLFDGIFASSLNSVCRL